MRGTNSSGQRSSKGSLISFCAIALAISVFENNRISYLNQGLEYWLEVGEVGAFVERVGTPLACNFPFVFP